MRRLPYLFLFIYIFSIISTQAENKRIIPTKFTIETKECLECHATENINIYQQWGQSKHYGSRVGCYECHKAKKGDRDAFMHNGRRISIIVSPKDCGRCHEKEVKEFTHSHHAKAARVMIGSLENLLAKVVSGTNGMKTGGFPRGISATFVSGCWQCHGSVINVLKNGKLDPATWPNTGIGRVNPDGSEGSCSACHQRHKFSRKQARQPENCGKCHMGPNHPQLEIYKQSKHGIAFYANKEDMNLRANKWVVGEDYFSAPTCATCHMSATKELPVSHNIGLRIKWNNRPVVSKHAHLSDKRWGFESADIIGEDRKENMIQVCRTCHNINFVETFYKQYEALLKLYEDIYARPGQKLYKIATKVLKAVKGKKYAKFANKIDYTWFELWHHEGRRARHGAAMQSPGYTYWYGTYVLARNWNTKFIPQIKEVIKKGSCCDNKNAKKYAKMLQVELIKVLNSKNHKWSIGKENSKEKKTKR